MIGQTVSHYDIVEKLGGGGMGVVYKAVDRRLGRTVALKFLPFELTRDDSAKARFEQEARAASAIDHPHICTIYEIDQTPDGQLFIVMAHYEGETLRQRLDRGPIGVGEAVEVALQVARGLAAAHSRGIVHRDVKPANIITTPGGITKILDFGLARLPDVTSLTQVGTTWGTVGYMSPEQAQGGDVDHRTDLWALGVVLYEMLTGRRPFPTAPPTAAVYAILHTTPAPLRSVNPDIAPELDGIVTRALAKSPAGRYQSAADLVVDLVAVSGRTGSRARGAPESGSRRLPSIAVLPFSDLSAAKDQDYFCEGLAEELINALAGIEGLRVAARTSAFRFKGGAFDPAEVGRTLNVETLLEGSVRKAGNRLRVTVQLVNVGDGYQLWSERYDRDLDDVFAVQDEIAHGVVAKLKVRLRGEPEAPLVRRSTADPEAYERYLKGRFAIDKRQLDQATEYFERALAIDPNFALAQAGLAEALSLVGFYQLVPSAQVAPKARAAAERALAIDDGLSESHSAQAAVKILFEWDWRGASDCYRRAVELNPRFFSSIQIYLLAFVEGRFDEALELCRRASERDPLAHGPYSLAGTAHYCAGRFDEAVRLARQSAQCEPHYALAHRAIGLGLRAQGDYAGGIAGLQRALELFRHPWFTAELGVCYALMGRTADAQAIQDELLARAGTSYVAGDVLSWIPFALGRVDEGLSFLDRGYEERSCTLMVIGRWPLPGLPLGHPRVRDLLRRMGIPADAGP
jgi:TolB-like protein